MRPRLNRSWWSNRGQPQPVAQGPQLLQQGSAFQRCGFAGFGRKELGTPAPQHSRHLGKVCTYLVGTQGGMTSCVDVNSTALSLYILCIFFPYFFFPYIEVYTSTQQMGPASRPNHVSPFNPLVSTVMIRLLLYTFIDKGPSFPQAFQPGYRYSEVTWSPPLTRRPDLRSNLFAWQVEASEHAKVLNKTWQYCTVYWA